VVRWALFAVASIVAAVAVTAAMSATGSLRATFTKPIPANQGSGAHIRIAWTLRDRAGHPVSVKSVFVRIVCPEGSDSTTTYAASMRRGLYAATAIVPPGGIGTVTIGAKGAKIRITNPFHR
jgi:hypothetical protein